MTADCAAACTVQLSQLKKKPDWSG